MKKRNKFKKFVKTTLFGEKLENALKKKTTNRDLKPNQIEENKLYVKTKVSIENEYISQIKQSGKEIVENKTISSPNFSQAEKVNEYWQIMESQFRENLLFDKNIYINLGIDLGTSFSKVVWRKGENSFPLCFGNSRQSLNDYLVPSVVNFNGDNITCGIDSENQKGNRFSLTNFKMCLACESEKSIECSIKNCSLTHWNLNFFNPNLDGSEVDFVNSYFLARLLAQTKKLVYQELKKEGFSEPICVKWTANFSVPEIFIEKSDISESFQKIFNTAWLMAEIFLAKPGLTDRESVFDCYSAAKDLAHEFENKGKPFDCFPYPEIGAEVASIVLSRTSEEGLYAFVDVGAGTVDASVFKFWRDGGETKRPPYAANIFKIGAANVEIRANEEFQSNSVQWLKKVKEEYVGLDKTERGQLIEPIVSYLKNASESVNDETYNYLIEVFHEAFRKEPVKERWQNLKLILGGGGSSLKAYQDAATRAFTLKDKKNPKKPETTILPKPGDFQTEGLPDSDFHRFAVAYGLSHKRVDLPDIIFAKDVAPMVLPKQKKNKRDRDDDR